MCHLPCEKHVELPKNIDDRGFRDFRQIGLVFFFVRAYEVRDFLTTSSIFEAESICPREDYVDSGSVHLKCDLCLPIVLEGEYLDEVEFSVMEQLVVEVFFLSLLLAILCRRHVF